MVAPLYYAGIYIVCHRIAKGEFISIRDFFSGADHWLQLFLGTLIVSIFTFIGTIFLLIPGIYLGVAYSFTSLFIIFGQMNFWNAMETSRKVITKQWWNFFGLMLVTVGIVLLGFLALGIGVWVAFPLMSCIYYAAFEDIVLSHTSALDNLIDELGEDLTQADPYTGGF